MWGREEEGRYAGEVLKAQEDLLTAQLREVENHNDGVQALINLYIALGGAVE